MNYINRQLFKSTFDLVNKKKFVNRAGTSSLTVEEMELVMELYPKYSDIMVSWNAIGPN